MENFYRKTHCDRCNAPLKSRTLSMMNMDVLCSSCDNEEKKHPKYREACDMEMNEILKGNRNFEGMFAGRKYPFL